MRHRCVPAAAAAWLLILLCAPAAAKDKHQPGARFAAQSSTSPASALKSVRALRRARRIVEMKMLELREQHLECARAVIERRLPGELLWDGDARRRFRGTLPTCLTRTR